VNERDGWFEVMSFSQSLVRRDNGTLTCSTSLVLRLQAETVELQNRAASGEPLSAGNPVRLEFVRQVRDRPTTFFSIELFNASIAAMAFPGYRDENEVPLTSLSLSFEAANWKFTPVNQNGTLEQPKQVSWNFTTNQGSAPHGPPTFAFILGAAEKNFDTIALFDPPSPLPSHEPGPAAISEGTVTTTSMALMAALFRDEIIDSGVVKSPLGPNRVDQYNLTDVRVRGATFVNTSTQFGSGFGFEPDGASWTIDGETGGFL
jgi:type VI protein secretion system component Hcp